MSKKLEQKQQRRLAEERRKKEAQREARKKNLITLGIAAVVIALVAFLVISDRQEAEGPVGVAAREAGCGDVEDVEAFDNQHIEVGADHEPYNSTPPTNGPHWPVGAQAPVATGFYDTAQPPEAVVHNLEHGQIVIYYSPDAPQQVKDDIEAIVEREPDSTVATPYEEADEYNFYMTAWNKLPNEPEESFGTGYLQGCDQVSQEVVDDFRTEYQGKSPEPITPPFRG
ncbi:MAG TPA: DUF3105 domain-containing protein [Actinomycetota bacterium]|nr:DUF3105 domain-containing protein [Actinomycetota bacterium]